MKRLLSLITLVCLLSLTVFGLTACDGPKVPEKLSAPVIVLEEDVATWEENSNADKFEISLNGELSYVENNYTSKKLNDGQSLKVRAIGDGINFTTSDWSNVVTYTAPKNPHTCDFSGEWKNDETHHWHECTCGEIDTKVEHSGGTATETEKAKCEVCGASYGELLTPPAHECDFNGEWKYDEAKASIIFSKMFLCISTISRACLFSIITSSNKSISSSVNFKRVCFELCEMRIIFCNTT